MRHNYMLASLENTQNMDNIKSNLGDRITKTLTVYQGEKKYSSFSPKLSIFFYHMILKIHLMSLGDQKWKSHIYPPKTLKSNVFKAFS